MKHIKIANMKSGSQRLASALKSRSRPIGVPALGHRSAGAQPHSSRIFQRQAPLG